MSYRCLFRSFIQICSSFCIWIPGALLILCLGCFGFSDSASAADQVLLIYQFDRAMVSYDELEAFANGEAPSGALQVLLQEPDSSADRLVVEHLSIDQQRALLNTPIVSGIRLDLGADLTEFAAIEVSRMMGEPLGRESFDSLETMLTQALSDDRSFTVIELVKEYPEPVVRLDLNRLERVYNDVKLFAERLYPLVSAVDVVMNDLFCDCTNEPVGPARIASAEIASAEIASAQTSLPQSLPEFLPESLLQSWLRSAPSIQPVSLKSTPDRSIIPCSLSSIRSSLQPTNQWQPQINTAQNNTFQINAANPVIEVTNVRTVASHAPLYLAQAESVSRRTDQEVVITFGPLARSIPMSDLTTLAETGQPSQRLRSLLRTAHIEPDHLQAVLNKEVQVSQAFLDKYLNSPLGSFALYEVGKVVRTRSDQANIQALRSALVLSAQDDNKLTLIEVLQNYPGPQVYLVGTKLVQLARLASDQNTVQEFAINQVQTVEDFLVNFQASIAADVCDCNAKN